MSDPITVIYQGQVCQLEIQFDEREPEAEGEDKVVEAYVTPVPISTSPASQVNFDKTLRRLGITIGTGQYGQALRSHMKLLWNERGASDARLLNSLFGQLEDEQLDEKTLKRCIELLQGLNRS